MSKIEENKFVAQLKEVNQNNLNLADMEMLREFILMMRQIECIPDLHEPEPDVPEEQSRQSIPLRLVRRCFGSYP